MNFAPSNTHTTSLFKNCNILKFVDIINVECFVFRNTEISGITEIVVNLCKL